MWHMVRGEHSLKISALKLLRFGIDSILKILNKKPGLLITYEHPNLSDHKSGGQNTYNIVILQLQVGGVFSVNICCLL